MMVALLVYAYSVGERSSRNIERRCIEDVAFRVVAANQCPDHAAVARFRAANHEALAGLFGQVLASRSGGGASPRVGGDRRHEARSERGRDGEPHRQQLAARDPC